MAVMRVLKRETCSKCGVTTTTYRRFVTPEMLRFVRRINELTSPTGGFVHTRKLFPAQTKASSDGSYLTKWALIERMGKGNYRITRKGKRFVEEGLKVPASADIKLNKVVGWGPEKSIDEM